MQPFTVNPDDWKRRMKFNFPKLLPSAEALQGRIDFVTSDIIFEINVSGNEIIDDSNFAQFLSVCVAVEECALVDLSETRAGPRCAELLGSLCASRKFHTLCLNRMKLDEEASICFVEKFTAAIVATKSCNISTLKIAGNRSCFLNLLPLCSALTAVDLSHNSLKTLQLQEWPLNSLTKLDAQACDLNGDHIRAISAIQTITELNISFNDLSSIAADEVVLIVSMKNLKILNCENCQLGPTKTMHFVDLPSDVKGKLEGDAGKKPEPNQFIRDVLNKLKERQLINGHQLRPTLEPSTAVMQSAAYATGAPLKMVQVLVPESLLQEFMKWRDEKMYGTTMAATSPAYAFAPVPFPGR